MWEHYKKSFWGMQLVIALMTLAACRFAYHHVAPTIEFFAILQVASVFGGYWAFRIKQRYSPRV
jgi:hypothetical protein